MPKKLKLTSWIVFSIMAILLGFDQIVRGKITGIVLIMAGGAIGFAELKKQRSGGEK